MKPILLLESKKGIFGDPRTLNIAQQCHILLLWVTRFRVKVQVVVGPMMESKDEKSSTCALGSEHFYAHP